MGGGFQRPSDRELGRRGERITPVNPFPIKLVRISGFSSLFSAIAVVFLALSGKCAENTAIAEQRDENPESLTNLVRKRSTRYTWPGSEIRYWNWKVYTPHPIYFGVSHKGSHERCLPFWKWNGKSGRKLKQKKKQGRTPLPPQKREQNGKKTEETEKIKAGSETPFRQPLFRNPDYYINNSLRIILCNGRDLIAWLLCNETEIISPRFFYVMANAITLVISWRDLDYMKMMQWAKN